VNGSKAKEGYYKEECEKYICSLRVFVYGEGKGETNLHSRGVVRSVSVVERDFKKESWSCGRH